MNKPIRRHAKIFFRPLALGAVLMMILSCGSQVEQDRLSAFGPLQQTAQNVLWIASAEYQSAATVSRADLHLGTVEQNVIASHSDAGLAFVQNPRALVVINRVGVDNLSFYDPQNYALQKEVYVGDNPQSIVQTPKGIYVSRRDATSLLKIDYPSFTPRELQSPPASSLSSLADEQVYKDKEGIEKNIQVPEMVDMKSSGSLLFILLQRMDLSYQVPDYSMVAIWDMQTESLSQSFKLQFKNPNTPWAVDENNAWYVGSPGNWFDENGQPALDGGIEKINIEEGRSEKKVISEQLLGGNIQSMSVIHSKLALVSVVQQSVLEKQKTRTVVFAVDLSEGKVIREVVEAQGYFSFNSICHDPTRQLFYVNDRDPKDPRVRVFSTQTLLEIPESAIRLGLPPTEILLEPAL